MSFEGHLSFQAFRTGWSLQYLDELPSAPPDRFGMGILELIAAKPETALAKAQGDRSLASASRNSPRNSDEV